MTTLERAARALEAAHIECAKASGNPIEGGEDYVAMARAVLMAVREPELNDGGGDIYRAGFEAMFDANFKDEYPMMSSGWEAMIDAILGENDDNA